MIDASRARSLRQAILVPARHAAPTIGSTGALGDRRRCRANREPPGLAHVASWFVASLEPIRLKAKRPTGKVGRTMPGICRPRPAAATAQPSCHRPAQHGPAPSRGAEALVRLGRRRDRDVRRRLALGADR
jgi:hypothetical protein